MEKEEIIKNAKEVISKARAIDSLLKSTGWKYFLEIKEKKKQEILSNMLKAEMTVKKHEYNRGAINFIEEIENELRGSVDDAGESLKTIESLEDKD